MCQRNTKQNKTEVAVSNPGRRGLRSEASAECLQKDQFTKGCVQPAAAFTHSEWAEPANRRNRTHVIAEGFSPLPLEAAGTRREKASKGETQITPPPLRIELTLAVCSTLSSKMPLLSGHPVHPVLVHRTALNKLKVRVLQSRLSDENEMNPEIHNRRITGNSKHLEMNTLLDHLWVREEFSRESRDCAQLHTREHAACLNLGAAATAVRMGKFMALNARFGRREISHQ